jgi:class 3 adenylate cyclase
MRELTGARKHVRRARHPGPRRQAPPRSAGSGAWRKLVPLPALALLRDAQDTPRKVRRHVAALFIDVQGCTRLCEDLPPEQMNELLETYFSEFLDAVRAAGGEVTEVMGDGLLALFEADDARPPAGSALRAALEVRARARRLNARRGRRHDPIEVNMGLNAGEALVGFTRLRGRSGERWVYAATGPVTNIAARLAARDGRRSGAGLLVPLTWTAHAEERRPCRRGRRDHGSCDRSASGGQERNSSWLNARRSRWMSRE